MQNHIYYIRYALRFADMQIPELVSVFNSQKVWQVPVPSHISSIKNLHESHDRWSASDNFCIYLTKKTVHSTERESFNYVLTFSFQNLANFPADEVKNHFLLLLMLRI